MCRTSTLNRHLRLDTVKVCDLRPALQQALLPQITDTSLSNSGHISISPIDLRQDVLKKNVRCLPPGAT